VRYSCIVAVLLASLAFGQAEPATPPKPVQATSGLGIAAPDAKVASLASNEAVITINDFCSGPLPRDGHCKTLITRAQFEKLVDALEPGMPLPKRLKVAYNYARIMQMAAAAEARGLDKTSAFAEEMRYARLQLLSQDLTRALRDDANNISEAEIADYYKKNEPAFDQATLARIFIPRDAQPTEESKSNASADGVLRHDTNQNSGEESMANLAKVLRDRAANGEDPDNLQVEAYDAAGIPGTRPKTVMENVRRATLPLTQELVMNLKPGEVSQVISDPGGAHFIYKMISKRTLSLEEASAEIHELIATQRFRDSMAEFQGDAVFSDAYFSAPGTASAPHRHAAGRGKAAPVATHNKDGSN
jgi:hypothetical protein